MKENKFKSKQDTEKESKQNKPCQCQAEHRSPQRDHEQMQLEALLVQWLISAQHLQQFGQLQKYSNTKCHEEINSEKQKYQRQKGRIQENLVGWR